MMTDGPILELGCGIHSSIFLHWACFNSKRKLLTIENNLKYFNGISDLKCDYHKIQFIKNWDYLDDVFAEQWSVALVDHKPAKRRPADMLKLSHVDYVIAHDTDRGGYDKLFKYRYDYDVVLPNTSVFSNKHNLKGLMDEN